MAYEIKDNSGSLFQNDKKEQETHADYNGTVKIAGVEYWINGWKKKTNDGKPFLGLSFKPKQPKANQSAAQLADDNEGAPF